MNKSKDIQHSLVIEHLKHERDSECNVQGHLTMLISVLFFILRITSLK